MKNFDATDELAVVCNVGKKRRPTKDNNAREKVKKPSPFRRGQTTASGMHTVTKTVYLNPAVMHDSTEHYWHAACFYLPVASQ